MKKHIVLLGLLIGIIISLVQCKKEGIVTIQNDSTEEINIDEITSNFKADYLQFKTGHDPDGTNKLSNPEDNYLDYKIFYANSVVRSIDDWTTCLDYNQENSGIHEMQFYYDYCKEFIDTWVNSPNNTQNKKYAPSNILHVDHTDDYGVRIIKHSLHFNYRKRSIMCTTVEPLPY